MAHEELPAEKAAKNNTYTLVLVPTRDLAVQVYRVIERLDRLAWLRIYERESA